MLCIHVLAPNQLCYPQITSQGLQIHFQGYICVRCGEITLHMPVLSRSDQMTSVFFFLSVCMHALVFKCTCVRCMCYVCIHKQRRTLGITCKEHHQLSLSRGLGLSWSPPIGYTPGISRPLLLQGPDCKPGLHSA